MIRRMSIYAHYVNGLPGGINNPLGARALYLYRGVAPIVKPRVAGAFASLSDAQLGLG